MFRVLKCFVICLFIFFQTRYVAFAQTSFPVKDWVKKLEAEKDINNENFRAINYQLLRSGDSVAIQNVVSELEKTLPSENLFFKARTNCLIAMVKYRSGNSNSQPEVKKLFDEALKEAYQTEDTLLISYISWRYGVQMYAYKEIELAATYCLRAVEVNQNFLDQSFGYNYAALLGEILFHCREYDKSISYTRWSIANWPNSFTRDSCSVQLWNTIGQAYQKLGMLDSAMVNYERSMAFANKTQRQVWKAINSGFEGEVLFLKKDYEEARPLLAYGYNINKDHDLNNAANSLQWLARINLIEGKNDSALLQAKETLRLLSVSDPIFQQKTNFLQQAYYTTADVYRSMGETDSFYRYFQLYITLHDSLERIIARSSIDISEMRNNNEKNFYAIQTMQREKTAEILKRNFIMAAIILISIIAFLYMNRSRIKLLYKEQIAKAEITAAKEQLQLFTQNIIEKTALVEKLQQQLQTKELDHEQQELINELSQNTILTEEDWEKFKTIFEKIYPGFFQKLILKSVDITAAEQRLAALTRLHFTSKQISRMLGISVDSVHKTRQRLRQRLHLSSDINLKQFVAEF
jgi:DNA-binding CsgD family transcriptional regulator/predicted transcriptional regulator